MFYSKTISKFFSLLFQKITFSMMLYILVYTSYYLAAMVRHVQNTNRKDFWPLLIHHIVIVLAFFMFSAINSNHTILLCQVLGDLSDFILEVAKSLRTAKQKKLSEEVFHIFAIVWIVIRNVIFPLMTMVWFSKIQYYPITIVLSFMMLSITCLNFFWTFLICRLLLNHHCKQRQSSNTSPSKIKVDEENAYDGL